MSQPARIAAVTSAGGPMGRAVVERPVADGVAGLALTDISGGRLKEAAGRLAGAMNRRMAEPAETAAAIAPFLREEAGFMTGGMLSLSGGIRPHL